MDDPKRSKGVWNRASAARVETVENAIRDGGGAGRSRSLVAPLWHPCSAGMEAERRAGNCTGDSSPDNNQRETCPPSSIQEETIWILG